MKASGGPARAAACLTPSLLRRRAQPAKQSTCCGTSETAKNPRAAASSEPVQESTCCGPTRPPRGHLLRRAGPARQRQTSRRAGRPGSIAAGGLRVRTGDLSDRRAADAGGPGAARHFATHTGRPSGHLADALGLRARRLPRAPRPLRCRRARPRQSRPRHRELQAHPRCPAQLAPATDAWLLVVDTRGINVWCAAGKGTFSAEEVAAQWSTRPPRRDRRAPAPHPSAAGRSRSRGASRQELCGFRVTFGPVRAADLPCSSRTA